MKAVIGSSAIFGIVFGLVILTIMPKSMKVFGKWHVHKPAFFVRNFTSEEEEFSKRYWQAQTDPQRLREDIRSVFLDLSRMSDPKKEVAFNMLFGGGSYWAGIIEERRLLLTGVFGERGYMEHPKKEQLDTMALVLLGKLKMLEENQQKRLDHNDKQQ